MARDSKEQRDIKIKALNKAVEILKEETTPSKNMLTIDNLIKIATENYGDKLKTSISPGSLKKPTSKEFKKIKDEIDTFKNEYKKIKSAAPIKSLKEVAKLKLQVENLMTAVARFYDDKLLLNEKLSIKENTISKLKDERDFYLKEIERLK